MSDIRSNALKLFIQPLKNVGFKEKNVSAREVCVKSTVVLWLSVVFASLIITEFEKNIYFLGSTNHTAN